MQQNQGDKKIEKSSSLKEILKVGKASIKKEKKLTDKEELFIDDDEDSENTSISSINGTINWEKLNI